MKYKVLLSIFGLLVLSFTAPAQVQKIRTIAGNGVAGFFGDGINAAGAQLWGPIDLSLDKWGNLYILDFNNNRIRKVNTAGLITTVAGTGTPGNPANGSVGPSANIYACGIAVDKNDNVFFTDASNSVVRKINASGLIYRVAGMTGSQGYTGDGGKADTARFRLPQGIAVDRIGNIYIADAGNHAIRKIDTGGFISTIAGTGVAGYFGDGGLATFAQLDSPYSVTVDKRGMVYINDFNNNVIRMVDTLGIITTITSNTGAHSYTGDNGLAVNATVNSPKGISVDSNNFLFIADALNNVVRRIDTFGIITTVAGNGTFGFGGDLGFVTGANFKNPYGVVVDHYGNIYIADANNQRVRKTYSPLAIGSPLLEAGVDEYPNPFSNCITLTGLSQSDKVCVYDITGRQVSDTWQATGADAQVFEIGFLQTGIYSLHVTDANGYRKAVLKLVKE